MNKQRRFLLLITISTIGSMVDTGVLKGARTAMAQEANATKVPKGFLLPNPSSANGDISDYTPELLQSFFRKEVEAYEIAISDSNKKLVLRPDPVINWKNPEVLNQGSLFVWMNDKRPAAIVSIFCYQSRDEVRRRHEVISFSPQSLVARMEGQVVWKPGPADLKGFVVAEEMEVATTAPRRLTQMRTIARDIAGKHITIKQITKELRLMPQPLIRYEATEEGLIDGSIFALSTGTDPEILVMIEARNTNSEIKWHLIPFRSHYDLLEMSYKNTLIWTAPYVPELMSSIPMQIPFAMRPFFVFTPPKPMPSPKSLK